MNYFLLEKYFRILKKNYNMYLRKLVNNNMPDFLCIGTQKGGTSSLYHLLKQHEEIFLPDNKEIHYFTKFYNLGDDWYLNHFNNSLNNQIKGEITPYYFFHEFVPQRIASLNKRIKIIVLLRNPIERTLSQYFHSVRLGLEILPLEKALAQEKNRLKGSLKLLATPGERHTSHQEHSYISRSKYDVQLKRYFQYFKRKNILVIKSEDLFESKYSCLQRISSFLNIRDFPKDLLLPKENVGDGESKQVSSEIRDSILNELNSTYDWIYKEYRIKWDL